MANSITFSLTPMEAVFANVDFLNEFEDHLAFLLRSNLVTSNPIKPGMALRFKGDFTGLMDEMGFPRYMVYPNMRLNGLANSIEFNGVDLTIQTLDMNHYIQLGRTWLTQRKTRSR